jgi:hypothetical protein
VVRFTRGELFFPTAVAPYVAQCSLWAGGDRGEATLLVAAGQLTLERLVQEVAGHRGRPLFLRFVEEPLGRAEYRRWRQIPRERLRGAGRFTTTGVLGRLLDAGWRGSLLVRGKVPAGLAAAAETTYRERLAGGGFTYYGRVTRDGGYICLQYWFFYAMNDWRSTFSGVNDHEADWEMVTVYLAEPSDGPPRPAWVALSSHDHEGDDLRRRWDDPELRLAGFSPVVFAGAGSHSGTFAPGDYVVSVDPAQLRSVLRVLRRLRDLLAPWRTEAGGAGGFGIPFVDYARGDGVSIGPGERAQWDPVLIDDETPWVLEYLGLWGLDTGDRLGGERAPAGPRYERSGAVRTSWCNPLGWAGLQKVAPDERDLSASLSGRVRALEREIEELDASVEAQREDLRTLVAQARSLSTDHHTRALATTRRAEVLAGEAELNRLIALRSSLAEERRTHIQTLSRPFATELPAAHIHRASQPQLQTQRKRIRLLTAWSAVSTSLLLGCIIVVLLGSPLAWLATVGCVLGLFAGVEAIARRRFLELAASVALLAVGAAAVVVFVILFHKHWRVALSVLLGVAAVVLLIANLRELRRR